MLQKDSLLYRPTVKAEPPVARDHLDALKYGCPILFRWALRRAGPHDRRAGPFVFHPAGRWSVNRRACHIERMRIFVGRLGPAHRRRQPGLPLLSDLDRHSGAAFRNLLFAAASKNV